MSDYKCKCGNTSDFFIEYKLPTCGLYCGECGKWIKWLNKDEERLFNHKHSLAKHDAKIKSEGIEELRVALQNKLHEEFTLTGADINEVAEQLKENRNDRD